MLNWAKLAGFAAILAVALGGSLLWALNNPLNHAEWSCKAKDDSNQPNNPTPNVIICNPAQPKKLGQEASQTNEQINENTFYDVKVTDILLALFTGFLVIVGAVQAYYLWGTVTATKVAAEHIPKVERAYVFAGPYGINTQPVASSSEFITVVAVQAVNYGKTPAVLHKVYGEFSNAEPTGKPRYLRGKSCSFDIPIRGNTGFNPTYLDARFQSENTAPHFFFGYVEYTDIFRNVRLSRFCAKIFPDEGRQEVAGPSDWNDWTS